MSDKSEDGLNLFPRYAEFFHQLVYAHVLKIFEHGCHRRPCPAKDPGTATFARNTFHIRTL